MLTEKTAASHWFWAYNGQAFQGLGWHPVLLVGPLSSKTSLPFATVTFKIRNTIAEVVFPITFDGILKKVTQLSRKNSQALQPQQEWDDPRKLHFYLLPILLTYWLPEYLQTRHCQAFQFPCHFPKHLQLQKQKLPRQQILLCHLYTYTHILKIMQMYLEVRSAVKNPCRANLPTGQRWPNPTATERLCWGIQKSTTKLQKFQELWEQTAFPASKAAGRFSAVGFFFMSGFFRMTKKTHEDLGGFVIAGLVL